jgi:hypothetical protein
VALLAAFILVLSATVLAYHRRWSLAVLSLIAVGTVPWVPALAFLANIPNG